eukprot:Hpha_TRINITY_DN29894_c0_g1::TRINITY_DN29894_c0_g1_i1::g.2895::m.2895/K01392/THOP1; thimet oligopeptidase
MSAPKRQRGEESEAMLSFTGRNVAQCAALFPKSAAEITKMVASAKDKATSSVDGLLKLGSEAVNFDSTARVLDISETEFYTPLRVLSVIKNTNPEKEIRDAATKSIVELQNFGLDLFDNNKPLYNVVKQLEPQAAGLGAEERYWVEETVKAYRRRGLELPDDKLAEVSVLQKAIMELSTQFSTNLAEDKTTITATPEEIVGVPPNTVAALKKDESGAKYILGMDYPTYFGVMKNCEVAETRQRMSKAFDGRGFPENMPVLHQVISKRHQLANLLGFPSYSHYDMDSKMAKNPDTARKFIADLVPRLQQKWEAEWKKLLADRHASVIPGEGEALQSYDIAFTMNQYKKKHLNVDETAIQEYFPLDTTIEALFKVYEAFFDIRFERHEDKIFWSDDVVTLAVYKKDGDVLIGHIALDLFPRDGKYTHACHHTVLPPVKNTDGTFSPAFSVVLANFPKATADKPALFLHDDVETFFHEFGHGIHALMGRTEMATVAGTSVKRDFVELPSQMLENWLWEPSILRKITSHYKTKEPLPQELIDAKVNSKIAFTGRDSIRQLHFATYALDLFSPSFGATPEDKMDSTGIFVEMQKRLMPHVIFNEATTFQCSFAHLMGYGACYYGYMWSEVFAADAFEAVRKADGLLSSEMGKRYIECIIGRGGSKDPSELLRLFLGRDPTPDAFFKSIGI